MGKAAPQQIIFAEKAAVEAVFTGLAVSDLPVEEATIRSWDLDVLDLDQTDRFKVLVHIFYDSPIGRSTGRVWLKLSTFNTFHDLAKKGYHDNPYHNYIHGADVVASVHRLMMTLRCGDWLSEIDMYALLVSALCHDIGHPGKTTPFLVATMHQ